LSASNEQSGRGSSHESTDKPQIQEVNSKGLLMQTPVSAGAVANIENNDTSLWRHGTLSIKE